MNYKLIVSNNKIYREIELTDTKPIKIGTGKDCEIRMREELFPFAFEIALTFASDTWKAACSSKAYLTFDDVQKYSSCPLKHNDHLSLKAQEDDSVLLDIAFYIDFESRQTTYDLEIDTSQLSEFTIGGSRFCDILLKDEYLGQDYITLSRKNNRMFVRINHSKYGVYLNGRKMQGEAELFDGDFLSLVGYSFCYKHEKILTMNVANLSTKLKTANLVKHTTVLSYPIFNRSSRFRYEIPQEEIEIKRAPPKPEKRRRNFLLTLLPALTMLALVIVLRGVMGNTSNKTFVIYSASSMAIGIVTSIASYFLEKKYLKEDIESREANYNEYIEEKKAEIKASRENELRVLNLKYASLRESMANVFAFDRRIFERNSSDDDFLDVWLGRGAIPAKCQIVFQKDDFIDKEDRLALLPESIAKEYALIPHAPVISKFGTSNCVGIIGSIPSLKNAMKNIVLDIAVRQFYEDVKLFFWMDKRDLKDVSWVRWLQHTQNKDLNIRNIMCDEESKSVLMEYLYTILSERAAQAERIDYDNQRFFPHLVIFVFNSKSALSKHPLSKFFEQCSCLGATFVFFDQALEYLPLGCNEIVTLKDETENGAIMQTANSDVYIDFQFPHVTDLEAARVARKLSGIYVDEVNLESELTRNITAFELFHIMSANDIDLSSRWAKSEVYKSMAAPLGVKKKGEIVYLDIGDKSTAHGPHGLVAGTTGSGKSEILQTYVLSMATLFHPYDVGFVIIDFKGGGMANQFKNLPHLIGTITNIDGREINRSLLSIKAELIKRQELFSENGVNHINDYIKLYKQGKVRQPLPHLIMIVDEFAELKAEFPDFMKEIISAARIGRTLGVHLILATQKPAGVVDNQIWSNSKFKLCLKVQTKEDSMEVLKSPLAAEIVEPGRAYFQVGNNEIFELFQSAYSGAKVVNADEMNTNRIEIKSLNLWGKRTLVYTNKKKGADENAPNQLESIVMRIHRFCDVNRIEKLPGICLPPIPDKLYIKDIEHFSAPAKESIQVPLGLVDDPSQQYQGALELNFSDNNTYVIGSAQTGKTYFLQTILYQLICNYTPQQINLYIIDCGNMALKSFEGASQIGGIVTTAEEERMQNLMKLLQNQIRLRKEKLQEKGLGTYKAYQEAGYTDLPQIIVFIDNIAVFREYYPDYDDYLMMFSRDGLSVGISLVVTSLLTNSIGFRVLSNFSSRIAFNCNDKGEYSNLFDRCKIEPKDVPGRGLCSIDKRVLEFQSALCIEGKKEIDRVENIKKLVAMTNVQYGVLRAAPIPEVPKILACSEIEAETPTIYKQGYRIPVGLNYDTVDFEYLDLKTIGVFGISGREKSGKTNFISHILSSLNRNIFNALTEAYVIDVPTGALSFCSDYGFVKHYTYAAEALEEYVEEIVARLEERQQMVNENHGQSIEKTLAKEPLLLLVIENNDAVGLLTNNKSLSSMISRITKQLRNYKVAILFTNLENTNLGFNAPDILKQIKDGRRLIVFDDAANVRIVDLSVKQAKALSKPIVLGDGIWFKNGEPVRMKTILNDRG